MRSDDLNAGIEIFSHQRYFFQNGLFSPYLMWLIAVSFVLFQFYLQLSSGVLLIPLMKSFHLSAFGGGFLISSFYFVYLLLQVPAGMLVDKFGARILLSLGGVVCAVGCLLFAISASVFIAIMGRILMGLGASCAFVSSIHVATDWFPEKRFTLMVGLAETFGMIGTLLGNVYLATVISHVSWRQSMANSALIALLLSVLSYAIIRENPQKRKTKPAKEGSFLSDVKALLLHGGLWLNGIYSGLIFAVVTVFASLWCLPYLVLAQQTTLTVATFESSFVLVGIAVGSPVMGYFYPMLDNKKKFLSLMAILASIICSIIIYETSLSVKITATLFFFLGLTASSYVFNFSIAKQLVPAQISSTSIGFTNALCVMSAPILQPFIGWLLNKAQIYSSFPINEYTLGHYHFALSIIPLALVVAAMIAMTLPAPNKDDIRAGK